MPKSVRTARRHSVRGVPLKLLVAASVAVFTAVLVPGVAAIASGGSVFQVQLDARPPVGEPWAFLHIFPNVISVHRGDVIDAAWAGTDTPHTATVVPTSQPNAWRSMNQAPTGAWTLIEPDTAAGGDDNELVINPNVLFPSSPTCGRAANPCAFGGGSVLNSGFQVSNPSAEPHFFVQMDAPVGQYSILCLVHPGMQIPVNVVGRNQHVIPPDRVRNRIRNQVHFAKHVLGPEADAQAQQVSESSLASGNSKWTLSAGGFAQYVSANEYPDAGVHVHVGDRIRLKGNFEIHTGTFPIGAANTVPFITTRCEVAGPDPAAASPADCAAPTDFQVVFNPKAIQPTASSRLVNPNRFVNSGLLAGPGTHANFVAKVPGTYTLVCLVHGPEMSTTVTVLG